LRASPAAPPPARPRGRGTLSEQLASIGAAAEELTQTLQVRKGKTCHSAARPSADLGAPLLEAWGTNFITGSLRTSSASLVRWFQDRVLYTLRGHPDEGTVDMHMYYAHFAQSALDRQRKSVRFKVPRALQYFGKYYQHDNPSHWVVVNFANGRDFQVFERDVYPLFA
jgi:hypothetical protein